MRVNTREKVMRLIHADEITDWEAEWLVRLISLDHAPNSGRGLTIKMGFDIQAALLRHLLRALA